MITTRVQGGAAGNQPAVELPGPAVWAPSPIRLRGPLPRLSDGRVTVRALTAADAPALLAQVGSPARLPHVAAGPRSVEEARSFIRWTHAQRARGRHLCWGVVPPDGRHAVGMVQVWPIEHGFSTAEWGFAVGAGFWGTGLFPAAAGLVLHYLFATVGVRRLEARAGVGNGRGNSVLRKLGATPEGLLRSGLPQVAASQDHVMWSLLAGEWFAEHQRSDGCTAVVHER